MFLDIGVGILSAMFVSWHFDIPLTFWLVSAGIMFALLPDIDFVFYFFETDKITGYKHRNLIHNPLLFVPAGAILIGLLFGEIFAVLFTIASFLHFVNDSFGIGRGVRWLYPFSKNGYAFGYLHSRQLKWGLWKPVFIFDEKYIREFDEIHGDRDWIKNIYFQPHIFSIFEYVIFIVSIIGLYFYVRK
ncbi:metal-dependent hydrolase [Patescibacteria group bacterium]|nr:MAG: metal-dependent hydrolase [Patescibacteria group bacterium]